MCKFNPKNDSRRIDPCMRKFIEGLNLSFSRNVRTMACCCGHGKYPMTIIVQDYGMVWDLVSGMVIPRKKRFYKKDKQGYYYIPEVTNAI